MYPVCNTGNTPTNKEAAPCQVLEEETTQFMRARLSYGRLHENTSNVVRPASLFRDTRRCLSTFWPFIRRARGCRPSRAVGHRRRCEDGWLAGAKRRYAVLRPSLLQAGVQHVFHQWMWQFAAQSNCVYVARWKWPTA